jgi:hypothetical protein
MRSYESVFMCDEKFLFQFSKTFDERGGIGAVFMKATEREMFTEEDSACHTAFWMNIDEAVETGDKRILESIAD